MPYCYICKIKCRTYRYCPNHKKLANKYKRADREYLLWEVLRDIEIEKEVLKMRYNENASIRNHMSFEHYIADRGLSYRLGLLYKKADDLCLLILKDIKYV